MTLSLFSIISGGLALGMQSTVIPILILAAGIILSYSCAGLYGVAIAAAFVLIAMCCCPQIVSRCGLRQRQHI